jgi:hypothetical protein
VVRELLLGRRRVLLESKYDLDLARGDGAVPRLAQSHDQKALILCVT